MSTSENNLKKGWNWRDADPMTQSVVAAFSGTVNDKRHDYIAGLSFLAAMTNSFDVTGQEVLNTFTRGGTDGLCNLIVDKMSAVEAPVVRGTITHIGRLAGGSEAQLELAGQVATQLSMQRYEAIPGLRVLADAAVSNLVEG
jgi:hypothetical protein